jgi:Domain of unknown function (DUF5615)
MKPRFLADADLNQKIVPCLLRRETSIDIHTAAQGDVIGWPDPEVLTIAARENRILISHDRGTMPGHRHSACAIRLTPRPEGLAATTVRVRRILRGEIPATAIQATP